MTAFDYGSLPAKRIATGALILNEQERLLIVRPKYREGWLIPGGVVETLESPRTACLREAREELGLEVVLGPLLCIEYRSAHAEETESVHFIFHGGVLSAEQAERITLPASELAGFRFVPPAEALELLYPGLSQRVRLALIGLREARTVYAEDGCEA